MHQLSERASRPQPKVWLNRAIFLFYACLLAEGAARKWLFPGASNALVFIRDPVMALILCLYAWSRPSPAMRRMLGLLLGATLTLVLCAACQAATTDVPGLVLLLGLRNYLFFIPLCFAIRDGFGAREYRLWLKLNLILAGPLAGLVLFQYFSPPGAFINAAPGGSNEGVFLLVEDVVRPYGLFSFALGQSAFSAWMIGLVLAAATSSRILGIGWPLMAASAASVAAMGVVSGSRTYFLLAGSTLLVFLGLAVVFGTVRVKIVGLLTTSSVGAAGTLAISAIPSLAANLLDRQATAVASEGSTVDRLQRVLLEFLSELDRTPLFGQGIGAGTNVANFLANGRTDHVLAEYELTRIVQELGPLFGLFYIAARWALLVGFVVLSVREARRGNLHPACFLGFLAPVFLAHDITLQNTMIGISWFATGIFLSAVRHGPALAERRSSSKGCGT